MLIKIKCNYENKHVLLNGKRLYPEKSQKVYNHSPDGFSWGYCGSGCSQIALAILLEITDKDIALRNYQLFKEDVISKFPMSFDWDETIDVSEYI